MPKKRITYKLNVTAIIIAVIKLLQEVIIAIIQNNE